MTSIGLHLREAGRTFVFPNNWSTVIRLRYASFSGLRMRSTSLVIALVSVLCRRRVSTQRNDSGHELPLVADAQKWPRENWYHASFAIAHAHPTLRHVPSLFNDELVIISALRKCKLPAYVYVCICAVRKGHVMYVQKTHVRTYVCISLSVTISAFFRIEFWLSPRMRLSSPDHSPLIARTRVLAICSFCRFSSYNTASGRFYQPGETFMTHLTYSGLCCFFFFAFFFKY